MFEKQSEGQCGLKDVNERGAIGDGVARSQMTLVGQGRDLANPG